MMTKLNEERELLEYLKTISLTYRENLNMPSAVKFGIEIEAIGNIMNKLKNGKNIRYYLNPDEGKNEWTLKYEEAFRGLGIMGAELSSPILTNTNENWLDIQNICSQIKNAQGSSGQCGGHIHYNVADILPEKNAENLIRILKVWVVFEKISFQFSTGEFKGYRRTVFNSCGPLIRRVKATFKVAGENASMEKIIEEMGRTRDKALNFDNLDDAEKNTIEVRIPTGTLEPVIWQNNINYFYHLLSYATSENYDEDLINSLYAKIKLNPSITPKQILEGYGPKDISNAIKLSDLIFTDPVDKLYFLKQYLKDGLEETKKDDDLQKSKVFYK